MTGSDRGVGGLHATLTHWWEERGKRKEKEKEGEMNVKACGRLCNQHLYPSSLTTAIAHHFCLSTHRNVRGFKQSQREGAGGDSYLCKAWSGGATLCVPVSSSVQDASFHSSTVSSSTSRVVGAGSFIFNRCSHFDLVKHESPCVPVSTCSFVHGHVLIMTTQATQ